MSIWPARLSVNGASKLILWFPPTFAGALVNGTALTLLLENFAEKKRFNRGVLPGFSDNKTGLILIFTPKFCTRAYFREISNCDMSINEVTK